MCCGGAAKSTCGRHIVAGRVHSIEAHPFIPLIENPHTRVLDSALEQPLIILALPD
jgi:hypothetical protein